jgi:4-amino-4-deoxy-L-arabinose transferase-like glycosyltransferase
MKNNKPQQLVYPVLLVLFCISFNVIISGHYLHKDLSSDETLYNWIALSILNGQNYYIEGGSKVDIAIEVTPFYSSLVALSYFVGGLNQWNPNALNVLFNCLTILLIFYTIKLITQNKTVAFLSSLAFIFYFLLWGLNFYIMMEISTVFFLTLALYFYYKYFYTKTNSFLYWSIAIFSLLCLINNRFIVLFAVLLMFQILKTITEKSDFRKSLVIPLVIVVLIMAPWFIRQAIAYNQFVLFTPTWNNVVANKMGILKKVNIMTAADAQKRKKPYEYSFYRETLKKSYGEDNKLRGSNAFSIEKYNELIRNINLGENVYLNRLKRYFTLYYKDFQFMAPNDFRLIVPSGTPFKIIQLLILFPLFIFSFLGIGIAIYKKDWIIILSGLLFFSHVLLHVLIHYIDRYRLTILPVLVIISGYFLNQLWNYVKSFSK